MADDALKPMTDQNFFQYMFKLTKFKQEELMNVGQYTLMAFIPIMILVYLVNKYEPDVDEQASTPALIFQIITQLLVIYGALFLIDRLINYFPTYSTKYYDPINFFNIILVTMFMLFMTKTRIGYKVKILLHRFDKSFTMDDSLADKAGYKVRKFADTKYEDIELDEDKKQAKKKKGQTQQQQGQLSQQANMIAPAAIQGPPAALSNTSTMNYMAPRVAPQQLPDYNDMYAKTTTPLINAATPGMGMDTFEPMAANEALGGHTSFF